MSPHEVIISLEQNTIDRYADYWNGIRANTDEEFFKRFLFAFMSVHTTWRSNVSGYEAICEFQLWRHSREELLRRLKAGRCGLYNNRARYIWQFSQSFWAAPEAYYREKDEPWHYYRNRLENNILGLGLAKTSFALEMAFPLECQVVCLDVHMLRLYGQTNHVPNRKYFLCEDHWVVRCQNRSIASYPARMVYWDSIQGKQNSRYWSHVFEQES